MFEVFRAKGFVFKFYSNEGFEPCHIHVVGHGGEAKFWVPSCHVVWSYNLKAQELRAILELVQEKKHIIQEAWNARFNR